MLQQTRDIWKMILFWYRLIQKINVKLKVSKVQKQIASFLFAPQNEWNYDLISALKI